MLQKIKNLIDIHDVGLYIFAIIVLAISWSGVKTIQRNYELQKQISVLKQQNTVLRLSNDNSTLQNKYLETDQYLELAARQNFGLAAPGETVLLVPKSVAMKYVDPSLSSTFGSAANSANQPESKSAQNLQDWKEFILGQ